MTDGPEVSPTPIPPRGAGAREATPRTPLTGSRRPDQPRKANYAARRMLVSTIGVAALIIAGVAAWRLTRDDTESEAEAASAWSQVVLVDSTTGAVTAVAPGDSPKAAARASATARVIEAYVEGDTIALAQAGQIALTTLDGSPPTIIPITLGAVVTRLPIADTLWLAVGSSSGGNIVLVDGTTGTTIDVGALTEQATPRYFVDNIRYDATGDTIAIADAGNFQTIVVHTDTEPPTADFFPSIPLAVTADRVVTSQVVGQQADFGLLDGEHEELAAVKGALPAAAVIDGDDVTVMSTEGDVTRFGPDDTEAEQLGSLAIPTTAVISFVRTTADGTRFVVFGDVFEAVVDLDGRTVFTTTFPAPVDAPTIAPGWACLPVGGGDIYTTLVDLDSGEVLADLTGMAVTSIADDGCTVLGTRDGVTTVIGRDGSVDLGEATAAVLAPDGRAAVVRTAGRTHLVGITDDWELDEPLDLTALTPPNPVIRFRDA